MILDTMIHLFKAIQAVKEDEWVPSIEEGLEGGDEVTVVEGETGSIVLALLNQVCCSL